MSNLTLTIWIAVIIVVLILAIYIAIYNGLQKAKVYTDEAWSQIDVQLKRRNAALYDQKLLTFPSNIVAGIHGFKKVDYLQTAEAEKEVPKVKF